MTAALAHCAFDPLRPLLAPLFTASGWPGTEALNALAGTVPYPPVTAGGVPVRFREPDPADATHYEHRIFTSGRVDTRPGNLHDLFNALAWLAFPRLKAALNARHAAQLPLDGTRRGHLRDALTLIDEGGVLVACSAESLARTEALIRDFRWQELFWARRAELLRGTRFVLFGHSAYEKALVPYPGITCKAVFFATPGSLLEGSAAGLTAWLDEQAAAQVMALPAGFIPRQMAPLPVFGYPGWLAESTQAGFYADRRWFRAGRAATAQKLGRAA